MLSSHLYLKCDFVWQNDEENENINDTRLMEESHGIMEKASCDLTVGHKYTQQAIGSLGRSF